MYLYTFSYKWQSINILYLSDSSTQTPQPTNRSLDKMTKENNDDNKDNDPSSGYFLGFDLSTQQLKCLVVDQQLQLVHSEVVDFDRDLPEYHTHKGVYFNDDGSIEAPVAMWCDALDHLFAGLANQNVFSLNRVLGISGSCQQHGSVYWSKDGEEALRNLDAQQTLLTQLAPKAFSRSVAPNWQDHSTGNECKLFESSCGGPQGLAAITGSRAHYRFTGPQICKVAHREPEVYANTANITLVSNFLASLLCGYIAPLEEADACGMNLYDIVNRDYDAGLLQNIDPDVESIKRKLKGSPTPADSAGPLSCVSSYYVRRYGLNPQCQVFPFTGDNLATICSLPLKKNDVLVSLGTSTTILIVTDQYHPSPNYHLFIHPTIPGLYMGMICYCNGSLARENVRDLLSADHSWDPFNKALLDSSVDNHDEIGVYFPLSEIVPSVRSCTKRAKFTKSENDINLEPVEQFSDIKHDVKNIVESQALSCRVRISPLLSDNCAAASNNSSTGYTVKFDYDTFPISEYHKRPRRAFFVGGASRNDAIVRTFAQVIGATEGNYKLETPNSCALGGCYKALWSYMYSSGFTKLSFDLFLNEHFDWQHDAEFICDSETESWEYYNTKIQALSALEATLE